MCRLVLGFSLLTLLSLSPLTADASDACPKGRWHDGTSAQPPIPTGERHCYDVHLNGPGHWLIDVQVAPLDTVEARIALAPPHCTTGDSHDSGAPAPKIVSRRASSVVLDVRSPGRYSFCIHSRDPHTSLGRYRLISTLAPRIETKSDPDEDEPDPDPMIVPGPTSRRHVAPAAKSAYEKEPLVPTCASWPALRSDDHGDAWPCATRLPIGRPLDGRLDDQARGDEDVFRLEIDAWRTIEIRSSSDLDLAAALYDENGHRLATDDDGAGHGDFRIVQHLAPGAYTVRVTSPRGMTGAYRLHARDID